MDITDMHAVTPDEASYEVTKALLPFLIEAGAPVYICRDDGVIFLVDLRYVQRGAVQVVL